MSRLDAFINVKGPNAVDPNPKDDGSATPFKDRLRSDPTFVVRRAILLRRFIEKHMEGVIAQDSKRASIDPKLLNALLEVEDYIHGARSIELLIRSMASRPQIKQLGLSDLPIAPRIRMFVHSYDTFSSHLI